MIDKNLMNNLAQNDTFDHIKKMADEILMFNLTKEAYAYIKNMKDVLVGNDEFKDTYPDKYRVYFDYYIKFKFLTLNRIEAEELSDFFMKYWVEQYNIDSFIDQTFFDLFDVCMMRIFVYADRDAYKEKVLEALQENKQELFSYEILDEDQLKENHSSPQHNIMTVGKLLQDFYKENNNKPLDLVNINKYLDKLQNKKKIGLEERRKVLHLLSFYKVLKTSSLDPSGIEEVYLFIDDKTEGVRIFNKGTVESINKPNISEVIDGVFSLFSTTKGVNSITREIPKEIANKQNQLMEKYILSSLNWNSIKSEMTKDKKLYIKPAQFQKYFHQAINSKDKEKIVAGLYTLAYFGHLDEIFERDQKIKEIFVAHLQKKFTAQLAEHFSKGLREPVYLSYFLQHILKDILRLSENESAVLAIKLVNELKRAPLRQGYEGQAGDKQYIAIAYGDLESGEFKWKEIIEKENKLYLEK